MFRPQDATADNHDIAVNVALSTYRSVTATFTFSIKWNPSSGQETTNDEILTVAREGGTGGNDEADNTVGSSDGSSTTETVVASDLTQATYHVVACGFANATPQSYTGTLVIKTASGAGETSLPSAPANGLAFTASVAADPQRDEAEPLIETAPDGRTYTCGPTGFGTAADYAQVSTDGGDQFHLLGTPPRGQQAVGGGGDCAIALAPDRNQLENYQYAYAGLGPLTGFTTSSSPDNGHTIENAPLQGNGVQSTGALADRQWLTFLDKDSVLLNYNQQEPRNIVVQRSDNGGLVYGPVTAVGGENPDFPGPMRTLPANLNPKRNGVRPVYFGWSQGDHANLSISYDGGASFVDCVAAVDKGQPRAGFVTVDNDTNGNIYLAYAEKAKFHTYMVTLPIGQLHNCNQTIGNNPLTAKAPKNDPQAVGWSTPVQVDRDAVRTTVFPWLAAGGAPGRVAVTFYGTETDGDPDLGSFKASWNVYVNQSVNALSSTRTFSQVRATTHPMHYDSICLNGLGCTVDNGDRSLADFFAIKTNPQTGRLQVVYNNDNKRPGEPFGHVASPMVVTQNGGPSIKGSTVSSIRPVVRSSSTDDDGDALANYSMLFAPADPILPVTPTPVPAADFLSTRIGKDAATGGFTVSMTLADLSSAALAKALTVTDTRSLLYVLRFSSGYQVAAAVARYMPPGTGQTTGTWTFKINDYDTLTAECVGGTSDDKCLAFGQTGTRITGSVSGNTITMTVPKNYPGGTPFLRALSGSEGAGQRPHEVRAVTGSRFYDASAFSFGDLLPDERSTAPQTFLYPLDNTPAMDFRLP